VEKLGHISISISVLLFVVDIETDCNVILLFMTGVSTDPKPLVFYL